MNKVIMIIYLIFCDIILFNQVTPSMHVSQCKVDYIKLFQSNLMGMENIMESHIKTDYVVVLVNWKTYICRLGGWMRI